MNRRMDKKKMKVEKIRDRLKRTAAIVFCMVLPVFSIRITDASVRRMIMCDDDRYALNMSMQADNQLRFDIAGEKFLINVEPVIRTTDYIVSGIKKQYESMRIAVRKGLRN